MTEIARITKIAKMPGLNGLCERGQILQAPTLFWSYREADFVLDFRESDVGLLNRRQAV